jgi:hypothetical protein
VLELQDGTRMISEVGVQDDMNPQPRKGGWCKLNGSGVMDLVGTTSSTSFTRSATFGRRHHSPPYNIFYALLWRLHPNVTFPWVFRMGVPKLELLLFLNFGRSYISQIKFVLKVQGQYLISFENIFPMVYNML